MNNNDQLLFSYRNGEKSAYLSLYNKYSSPLRKFLQGGFSFSSQGKMFRFRGVDPSMDAEALVQETFLRIFAINTRKNYDSARPFQTYLFSIAKNLVLRECHHRDRLIHVEQIEDKCESPSSSPFPSRPSFGQSPEAHVQNSQLKKITERFVAGLNKEEGTFFDIRFAQENTQEGTASLMSTTRARIKLLEKNMRKKFLELMRENGYFVDHEICPRWKRKEGKKMIN